MAERQQNKTRFIKAERGSIKDVNGEVLSYTRNDWSLFIDVNMVDDSKKRIIAEKFASVFGKNTEYYLQIMNSAKARNVCLEKKISKEQVMQFNNFTMDALRREEDFSRIYPYGSMGSHVIGYVDIMGSGVSGIEKVYNEYLTGSDGIKFIENDAIGRTVSVKEDNSRQAVPGNEIILTIDKNYQKILEEEIKTGITKYEGKSGVGIIMNPNSGEIIAMANIPDYDPANYNLFGEFERKNRIVTDTYEPGSTIKPIIMSILLEEELANPEESIDTENGVYLIKRTQIKDTHPFEKLTVRQIIEQSSNIGMAKLSARVKPETFYKYLRDFGFGNKTSIDLIGETEGNLKKPKTYSKISKTFMSFGYEISVTPLQLITAFSSVINGGILYKPYVVKRILDQNKNIVKKLEPMKIRRVISERTSDKIKDFMIGVVEEGTARNARLNNVLIGGKTGTSQKLIEGKYSKNEYNSSFVGFLPADNPQLICLIVINSPKVGRYGGQVAAPIFREIASRIIEADPSLIRDESRITRNKKTLDEIFARVEFESESNAQVFLTSNLPEVTKNIKATPNEFKDLELMPDLINLSVREAVTLLNEMNINYKISGSGKVIEQSIEPGTEVQPGLICLIKCATIKNLEGLRIN